MIRGYFLAWEEICMVVPNQTHPMRVIFPKPGTVCRNGDSESLAKNSHPAEEYPIERSSQTPGGKGPARGISDFESII